MEKFISKIKELRTENKLTTRQLAEAIGVSQSYLSQLENGYRTNPPTTDVIKNLSYALKYDYFSLLRLAGYLPSSITPDALIEGIPITEKRRFLESKKIKVTGELSEENIEKTFLARFKEKALIGDWISLLRERTGKSLVRVAIESDLTTEEVIDIEMNKFKPSYKQTLRIGEALGVEDLPSWIVSIPNDAKELLDSITERREQTVNVMFQYPKWEWVEGDKPYEKFENEVLPEEARQRFLYLENLLTMNENIYLNKKILSKQEKERALKILKLVFNEEE